MLTSIALNCEFFRGIIELQNRSFRHKLPNLLKRMDMLRCPLPSSSFCLLTYGAAHISKNDLEKVRKDSQQNLQNVKLLSHQLAYAISESLQPSLDLV